MKPTPPLGLIVRPFELDDTDKVISVWEQCGLVRSWNDPKADIERKASFQNDLFLVGSLDADVIATAMFGYDGHRGWLNYFAVHPAHQGQGFGAQMQAVGEAKLTKLGCPKLNLQIRSDNDEAAHFYERAGYSQDDVASFGKRLSED